jgi:hypothetical protein
LAGGKEEIADVDRRELLQVHARLWCYARRWEYM